MSETAGDIGWLGSEKPGSHNEEVYNGVLGIDIEELAEMEKNGVI